MKAKKRITAKRRPSVVHEKRLFTERHLGMTIEDWRLKKRQEWRAVTNALKVFNYGSAYTPVGNDFYELERAAGRISEALVDDWVPY